MQIADGLQIKGLGLLIANHSYVIADLHLGYESTLVNSGVLLPKHHLQLIEKHLKKYMPNCEQVIINGDLKHGFGMATREESENIRRLTSLLKRKAKKIIIIDGNHDRHIEILAKNLNLKTARYLIIDNNLVCHGDEIIKTDEDYDNIIIGHQHPALKLSDGIRTESYKCFLKGNYKGKTVIALPSLNFVTIGSDIRYDKSITPYLKSTDSFTAYAVEEDKILEFEL